MRVVALVLAAMLAAGCTVLMVGDESCCHDIQLETAKEVKAPEVGGLLVP